MDFQGSKVFRNKKSAYINAELFYKWLTETKGKKTKGLPVKRTKRELKALALN